MEEKNKLIKTRKKTNTINKQKVRNPGVDLCRILGMIDIVIFHLILSLYKKFSNKFNNQIKYMEILTQWHISNFGIISGIVGFKTNKYSNLLYLYLMVLFYSLTFHYIYNKYFSKKYNFYGSDIVKNVEYYFPLIYNHYWYFTTYFGMYLFLPLINKGLFYVNKEELLIILVSTIGIFFIWKDLMSNKPNNFCTDTSITTLLVYFLIGAYIGKYVINENMHKNKHIFYYLFWILIFIISSYITYYSTFYIGNNKYKLALKRLFYCTSNSIGMVLESISIILIFTQIKYNKYLGKIISFFGPLTFSVYLTHNHMDVRGKIAYYLLKFYPDNCSFTSVCIITILNGIKVYGVCIIIDYIRSLLFKLLRIRQICIFIEKIIFSFFKITTGQSIKNLKH